MDKFKEQIMVNALKSDPSNVTFDNIDEFFKGMGIIEKFDYALKLQALINNTTIYNKTLIAYIIGKRF